MKITEKQLFSMANQAPDTHPSAEQLAQLLEPVNDHSQQEQVLDHLEQCSECTLVLQQILEMENETQSFVESLGSHANTESRKRNRWLFSLATAAGLFTCVLLLTILLPENRQDDSYLVRGESAQLHPPVGQLLSVQPETLAWQDPFGVPVHVALMDGAARQLWQSVPTEKVSVTLPAELDLAPGTYFWQIYDSEKTVVAGPFWFEIR